MQGLCKGKDADNGKKRRANEDLLRCGTKATVVPQQDDEGEDMEDHGPAEEDEEEEIVFDVLETQAIKTNV